MNLLELTVWWLITFTPFIPIPRDVECVNPKCDSVRFTIREDGDRYKVVWNEEQVLSEVMDSTGQQCDVEEKRVAFDNTSEGGKTTHD